MRAELVLGKENVGREFYFQGHVYMVVDRPCGPYGRDTTYVLREKSGRYIEENHDLMDIINGDFERMR